jgi:hypothetical protein
MLCRCGSMMAGWTSTTQWRRHSRGMSQWEGMLIECFKNSAGKPVSFDAKDSHGSGRGSVGGDAMTGGRCAPFLGMTLLTSHKFHSMLS